MRREVPAAAVDKEKEIYTAQALESGKPAEIVEKMIGGRIKKFLAENSLVEQAFVKDPDGYTIRPRRLAEPLPWDHVDTSACHYDQVRSTGHDAVAKLPQRLEQELHRRLVVEVGGADLQRREVGSPAPHAHVARPLLPGRSFPTRLPRWMSWLAGRSSCGEPGPQWRRVPSSRRARSTVRPSSWPRSVGVIGMATITPMSEASVSASRISCRRYCAPGLSRQRRRSDRSTNRRIAIATTKVMSNGTNFAAITRIFSMLIRLLSRMPALAATRLS